MRTVVFAIALLVLVPATAAALVPGGSDGVVCGLVRMAWSAGRSALDTAGSYAPAPVRGLVLLVASMWPPDPC